MYTIQFSYFTSWFYGDTEFVKCVSPGLTQDWYFAIEN